MQTRRPAKPGNIKRCLAASIKANIPALTNEFATRRPLAPIADVVAIGLRAVASAAALLAAGLPIFLFLYGQLLDRALHSVRSIIRPSALVALALVLLHAVIEPVRLVGAWGGALDPSLHALLLSSAFGTTLAIRILGLVLLASSTLNAGRPSQAVALAGATLIAGSFAFMGHTANDPQRWLLAPFLVVHLAAIAFWFGALWPLLLVTRHETAVTAGKLIGEFSRTALVVVPFVLLAGLTMSAFLLPSLSALMTPYGLSLVAKACGFAALMALAALNKWRLTPGIANGNRRSIFAFRISVQAEVVLIIAVITVTAVMTALFSPDH